MTGVQTCALPISTSGPSPFDAVLASLVSGNDYTFTMTLAGGPEVATLKQFDPVASLHPVISGQILPASIVAFSWIDVGPRLARPIQSVNFRVESTGITIFELEDAALDRNFILLPEAFFTNGQSYSVEVSYTDVGGASQVYILDIGSWPTIPVLP